MMNPINKHMYSLWDSGDPSAVQESVAELERSLAAFDSLLAAKHQEAGVKEQQGAAFESAKTLAILWLSQMEARLDEFDPVAIEVDMVEQQIMQLQVMTECVVWLAGWLADGGWLMCMAVCLMDYAEGVVWQAGRCGGRS